MKDETVFDQLRAANARHSKTFVPFEVKRRAAKSLAILTCMDPRIRPLEVLGLAAGDAAVIRNAGGRATADALRSLVLANAFLTVRDVLVMHHSDCALGGRHESEIRAGLDPGQGEATAAWDFLAMPDPDRALGDDVEVVRSHPALVGRVRVEGWRYDVTNGTVERLFFAPDH